MVRHALRGCSPAQRRICVLALVTVGLLFFIANSLRATTPRRIQPSGGPRPLDSSVVSAHAYFWQNFKPILERHAPTCPPPERTKTAQGQRYDANNAKAQRPNYMLMPGRDVDEMRTKHAGFVKAITTSPITPYHRPGTRGLVTTAGGPYLPIFAVSLRMLRRTGSTLPVEVFLADAKEYEPYICDVVFRDLNARCVVLDEILSHGTDTTTAGDQKDDKKQIKSYQFKPLAMLFSSFEELMFIDADAFPLHDPQLIFDSALFKRFQLITWPDFWGSSASPLYYTIASQTPPPLTERASTESGEIFINKRTHKNTLLLAMYYNYHGPGYYYPLFSQGGPGEGDKETFLAAATVMRESFHQVSERLAAIGRRKADGSMAGSAMVQFDPMEDYQLTVVQGKWRTKDDRVARRPRPFFVHANTPKFNPATIFDDGHYVDPVRDEKGKYTRPWTIPEDMVDDLGGVQFEMGFWKEIRGVACELEDKFESWKNKSGICERVRKYYEEVFAPFEKGKGKGAKGSA